MSEAVAQAEVVCWDELEDWSEVTAEVLRIATADPRDCARRHEIVEELEGQWDGARDAVLGISQGR